MTWFSRRRRCPCSQQLEAIEETLDAIMLQLHKSNQHLADIAEALQGSADRPGFRFKVGPTVPREVRHMPLALQSTNEEKIKITVTPVTSTGNPAELDGPVRVTVVSGDGTSEAVDDTSFFVVSSDNPGDTTYLVEADADLGEGVTLIQDTITYTVTGALAVNLGMTAGSPEPK